MPSSAREKEVGHGRYDPLAAGAANSSREAEQPARHRRALPMPTLLTSLKGAGIVSLLFSPLLVGLLVLLLVILSG